MLEATGESMKYCLAAAILAFFPGLSHAGGFDELLNASRVQAPPPAPPVSAAPLRLASAQAQKAPAPFAVCTGTLDGARVQLKFLAGKTGEGVMLLAFGEGEDDSVPHPMTILSDDEKGTRVAVYAAMDPGVKFAEFTIPAEKKSRVTIHAIHFHADWMTADCSR
jgi:hypothetical protein